MLNYATTSISLPPISTGPDRSFNVSFDLAPSFSISDLTNFATGADLNSVIKEFPISSSSVIGLLGGSSEAHRYKLFTVPTGTASDASPTLDDERIYDRRAALKIKTAEIAMHLDEAWRAGLFKSLDRLLDAEEWDLSDELPSDASYRTFLRMIIFLGKIRRPSLGATSDGNIIAGWMHERDRLVMECLPNDMVRWSLTKFGDFPESAAGITTVNRLPSVLQPYEPARWLNIGRK